MERKRRPPRQLCVRQSARRTGCADLARGGRRRRRALCSACSRPRQGMVARRSEGGPPLSHNLVQLRRTRDDFSATDNALQRLKPVMHERRVITTADVAAIAKATHQPEAAVYGVATYYGDLGTAAARQDAREGVQGHRVLRGLQGGVGRLDGGGARRSSSARRARTAPCRSRPSTASASATRGRPVEIEGRIYGELTPERAQALAKDLRGGRRCPRRTTALVPRFEVHGGPAIVLERLAQPIDATKLDVARAHDAFAGLDQGARDADARRGARARSRPRSSAAAAAPASRRRSKWRFAAANAKKRARGLRRLQRRRGRSRLVHRQVPHGARSVRGARGHRARGLRDRRDARLRLRAERVSAVGARAEARGRRRARRGAPRLEASSAAASPSTSRSSRGPARTCAARRRRSSARSRACAAWSRRARRSPPTRASSSADHREQRRDARQRRLDRAPRRRGVRDARHRQEPRHEGRLAQRALRAARASTRCRSASRFARCSTTSRGGLEDGPAHQGGAGRRAARRHPPRAAARHAARLRGARRGRRAARSRRHRRVGRHASTRATSRFTCSSSATPSRAASAFRAASAGGAASRSRSASSSRAPASAMRGRRRAPPRAVRDDEARLAVRPRRRDPDPDRARSWCTSRPR